MEPTVTFQASVVSTFNVKIGGDHYTTYKIRVVPYDNQDNCDLIYVNKRYNDFGDLYVDLKKSHKNIREFDFPEKKAIGKLDAALVQKRVEKFNEFLQEITKYDIIAKDPRVLSFLNISEKDKPFLRVTVLESLNLQDYAKDAIIYPFFEIYCCKDVVGRQKIGKSDYTASAKESDSASYKNDEFTIPLTDSEVAGVRINLWDKKSSSKKAFVNIPLNSIPFNSKIEHWFIFSEIDKHSLNAAGLLKLRLYYHNTSGIGPIVQELQPTDPETIQAKKRPRAESGDKPRAGQLHLGFKYIPPKGPWSGSITIHVKDAKDLQANGNCDPCVALSYLRGRKCTETKKSTTNPSFNQKFQYPLTYTQVAALDFGSLEINAYNMAGDRKLIGSAHVKFEDFLPVIENPGEEYDVEGTVYLHKE